MCGTMLPLSVYSGKILLQVSDITMSHMTSSPLQTSPEHILPLLDKSLREVRTLVLYKNLVYVH